MDFANPNPYTDTRPSAQSNAIHYPDPFSNAHPCAYNDSHAQPYSDAQANANANHYPNTDADTQAHCQTNPTAAHTNPASCPCASLASRGSRLLLQR